MKAALIPPIPALKRFGQGDFHLLLSHLLTDPRYKRHYIVQRMKGAYLVLDNSAHEFSAGESAEKLLVQATEIEAQELVVPDVLEDMEATVEGTLKAWEAWHDSITFKIHNPSLMYVPQGETEEAWALCLREQVRIHLYMTKRRNLRRDFVIGLSKDYEKWEGGLSHLIGMYLIPTMSNCATVGINVQLHLLGWGRDLWALGDLARSYPWIRSTDSAKPFVYALAKIALDPLEVPPEYPTRPADYFSKTLRHKTVIDRAYTNIAVFKGLAREEVHVEAAG